MDVAVFHDESGLYTCDDWVFTGLLWVEEARLAGLHAEVTKCRQDESYFNEVHFSKIPSRFEGRYGADARLARRWFREWAGRWADSTWFTVFAVQRRRLTRYRECFGEHFHAYNRFTAMALKTGLSWHFRGVNEIALRICSDAKSRRPQGLVGDGVLSDNFEEYLVRRLGQDTRDYKGPGVHLTGQVECRTCERHGPYTCEEDLLQLTDLLLGSTAAAVHPRSERRTKLWFGSQMATLLSDTRRKPWEQEQRLHRRLSLSYFPDRGGKAYSDGPLGIESGPNQQSLF